jgi:predicted XRE-type DNA-binding protein
MISLQEKEMIPMKTMTKKPYKQRTFAPLPKSFYAIRNGISDEINRVIEERILLQQEAADLCGITVPRMSKLQNKRFTQSLDSDVVDVTAWCMLEALMALGANLTVSISSYSHPGKGTIQFVPKEGG